jgi:RNA polymerase sigma-70 factor (ECF subfamily)
MTHDLSDAELVEQVQAGSGDAMSLLYRRHRQSIYRYAYSRLYNQRQAQDAAGEIFLRMVANLPQYRNTGAPFAAWLFRIAHNYIITYRQKENKSQLASISQADHVSRAEDNPAFIVERQLQLEWVWQGLQQLDENQSEVIIMRFLIGLSLRETAHALDKTVGAVKTLQHRGILALRVALQAV